jgi:hypothetical protein
MLQDVLRHQHDEASAAAFERLHRESFGHVEGILDPKLQKALDKEFQDVLNRNEVQSTRLCSQLESQVWFVQGEFVHPVYLVLHCSSTPQ